MKLTKRLMLFLAFCLIGIVSVLAVQPLLHPSPQLGSAITKAINYFENASDPHALLMLDVLHRHFGIEEFADSLQRYDEILEKNPQNTMLRLFRRIAYHGTVIQEGDLNAISVDLDFVTVPALYSDQLGLSDDYIKTLTEAANGEGYLLTHALLACIWIQENGCESALPEGLIEKVCEDTAALVGNDPIVEDLELEAAVLLYLAGQGQLVDETFIEKVIEAQNEDGGWSISSTNPNESNEHATVFALTLLLRMDSPVDSYPPMLAP